VKKRLPLLIALGVGALLWKTGAFGLMASERTVVWRFPVSYGQVRWFELQVWDDEALLAQQERNLASGLGSEPEVKVALARGPHRGIARVLLVGEVSPLTFQQEFDPGTEETVVLEMKKP
jgi:hypothetical protein